MKMTIDILINQSIFVMLTILPNEGDLVLYLVTFIIPVIFYTEIDCHTCNGTHIVHIWVIGHHGQNDTGSDNVTNFGKF